MHDVANKTKQNKTQRNRLSTIKQLLLAPFSSQQSCVPTKQYVLFQWSNLFGTHVGYTGQSLVLVLTDQPCIFSILQCNRAFQSTLSSNLTRACSSALIKSSKVGRSGIFFCFIPQCKDFTPSFDLGRAYIACCPPSNQPFKSEMVYLEGILFSIVE
jgi:hypothetical protein